MISSVNSYSLSAYTNMRAALSASTRSTNNSITGIISPSTSAGNSVDFSRISGNELRGWVNAQIESGKMSLDDSTPFMAMTMAVPTQGDEMQSNILDTKTDFVEKTQAGLQGAL